MGLTLERAGTSLLVLPRLPEVLHGWALSAELPVPRLRHQ
jgi:hypothetical protein